MEGMSKEEWLNREIVPTDFTELAKQSNALFRVLDDKMRATKQKKC